MFSATSLSAASRSEVSRSEVSWSATSAEMMRSPTLLSAWPPASLSRSAGLRPPRSAETIRSPTLLSAPLSTSLSGTAAVVRAAVGLLDDPASKIVGHDSLAGAAAGVIAVGNPVHAGTSRTDRSGIATCVITLGGRTTHAAGHRPVVGGRRLGLLRARHPDRSGGGSCGPHRHTGPGPLGSVGGPIGIPTESAFPDRSGLVPIFGRTFRLPGPDPRAVGIVAAEVAFLGKEGRRHTRRILGRRSCQRDGRSRAFGYGT